MGKLREQTEEDLRLRRYSKKTRNENVRCVANFVRHFKGAFRVFYGSGLSRARRRQQTCATFVFGSHSEQCEALDF
jgi:hypothetical protein